MRKQHNSRTKDFNKKYEGEGKKKTKEVTCYECKKPSHIRSECPKLKSKNKGAKDRKKAFKATWDDTSESEMEEEQNEVVNLCFMALEDNNEVPSTSHFSCDDCDDYDDDDDDDDESSIVSKLILKCKSLLSKKNYISMSSQILSRNLRI